MMLNTVSQFSDAIKASGLEPPTIIKPGKIHRFPGIGKQQSNRSGWCMLFDDGMGGCYGDWASDLSENWQAKRNKSFSHAERSTFTHLANESKTQAEVIRNAKHVDAANRASAIWNGASPAPGDHPYLMRKGIKMHNARLHKDSLVLPVVDFSGMLSSLQFIGQDGNKLLLPGGRKQGCFIPIKNDASDSTRVIICEGWATGCTLAEDDPASRVLAAIDAGNLKQVAVAARSKWPSVELVIAGDDDRLTAGNPGVTKARAAAITTGALLAIPHWPVGSPETLTDFNDLALWIKGGLRG
jgi:putative DNA primase/helicase